MKSDGIYELIESCLKQLADIDFQMRVWVRGQGPEVSTFVETVCQLFDDTTIGDQLGENPDQIVLSEELDPIFKELHEIIHSIDYRLAPSEILNHANWPKVRQLASQALILVQERGIINTFFEKT